MVMGTLGYRLANKEFSQKHIFSKIASKAVIFYRLGCRFSLSDGAELVSSIYINSGVSWIYIAGKLYSKLENRYESSGFPL